VVPIGTKGCFTGWFKRKTSIQSHMCCVGGVTRKFYARQKVTTSNPAGCRVIVFALYVPLVPIVGTETKDPGLWSRTSCPDFKTGTKGY